MATRSTLIASLEREFCPTLDSSLIAALLSDIHDDATDDDIDALRQNLRTLFLEAEESQFSEFSESQLEETDISSWTTPDNGAEGSSSSASSTHSFSTPIGFLQAALPDVSQKHLQAALDKGEQSGMEMWDIVASVLTEQTIREMEERGLDGLESEEVPVQDSWETVGAAKRKSISARPKAPKRTSLRKIALADVRQQHHISNIKHPPVASPILPSADPWTQIASISDQLAVLLPPHPPSLFSSYFHSPKHATSYDALRAALSSLADESDPDHHTAILFNLLDIVMPEYEDSDDLHKSHIVADAQLAVAVTMGRADDSLDVFNLLRSLDTDTNGDLGIYHQQPTQAWDSQTTPKSPIPNKTHFTQPPTGPPPIPPPPAAKVKQKAAAGPPARNGKPPPPAVNQWQTVPQRKFIDHGPHPLAHHIPAYTRNVNGMKTARAYGVRGTTSASAGNVAMGSGDFRRRMDETMRKRNEALREASRMWQKGNAKSRGGEVAFYFAERARELQEVARQEALNAAREMVLAKRITTPNGDTVDLHGTTVAEAVVIVKEIVNDKSTVISPAKPLKIITGRGSHSVNQVGVLKPALKKSLIEDGWVVAAWDAGLIVRQRRT